MDSEVRMVEEGSKVRWRGEAGRGRREGGKQGVRTGETGRRRQMGKER